MRLARSERLRRAQNARELERRRAILSDLRRHDALVRLRREEEARAREEKLWRANARKLRLETRRAAAERMLREARWVTGSTWAAGWVA